MSMEGNKQVPHHPNATDNTAEIEINQRHINDKEQFKTVQKAAI